MLTSQMLPAIVFVIPLFVLFSRMDIVNTLPGLILGDMTFTVPFALVMLGAYLREFPYQLVEAALVDGAGQWRAFFSIAFALSLALTIPDLGSRLLFSLRQLDVALHLV